MQQDAPLSAKSLLHKNVASCDQAPLKVCLHAAIFRLQFVFWRMRNTADATIRHRKVQVVI